MGEIIFSLFIGMCLVAIGLFMNWTLSREQRDHDQLTTRRHQE